MPPYQIHFHDKSRQVPLLLLQCWSPPFLQSWSFVMRYSIIILFALLNASLTNALPLQKRCVVPVFDSCNCLTPLAGLTLLMSRVHASFLNYPTLFSFNL